MRTLLVIDIDIAKVTERIRDGNSNGELLQLIRLFEEREKGGTAMAESGGA